MQPPLNPHIAEAQALPLAEVFRHGARTRGIGRKMWDAIGFLPDAAPIFGPVCFGVIVTAFGIAEAPQQLVRLLGFSINLALWQVVLILIFGYFLVAMALGSYRAATYTFRPRSVQELLNDKPEVRHVQLGLVCTPTTGRDIVLCLLDEYHRSFMHLFPVVAVSRLGLICFLGTSAGGFGMATSIFALCSWVLLSAAALPVYRHTYATRAIQVLLGKEYLQEILLQREDGSKIKPDMELRIRLLPGKALGIWGGTAIAVVAIFLAEDHLLHASLLLVMAAAFAAANYGVVRFSAGDLSMGEEQLFDLMEEALDNADASWQRWLQERIIRDETDE